VFVRYGFCSLKCVFVTFYVHCGVGSLRFFFSPLVFRTVCVRYGLYSLRCVFLKICERYGVFVTVCVRYGMCSLRFLFDTFCVSYNFSLR